MNGVRDGSQDKGWNPAIRGRLVDGQGRCVHWHSPLDVVANRFACCDEYYACYRCHDELTGHDRIAWRDMDSLAVMCGVCRHQMTPREYGGRWSLLLRAALAAAHGSILDVPFTTIFISVIDGGGRWRNSCFGIAMRGWQVYFSCSGVK